MYPDTKRAENQVHLLTFRLLPPFPGELLLSKANLREQRGQVSAESVPQGSHLCLSEGGKQDHTYRAPWRNNFFPLLTFGETWLPVGNQLKILNLTT